MAALYEGFTLCGLAAGQSGENWGILGIEPGRDTDHVIVTGAGSTVTVYKVSDQKPLGSWAAKQGQAVTCPAVRHGQTGEYVAVHDSKVLRIWRDEDINFEKVFKATLSAAVSRIHALPSSEPLVLFQRGAVRQLDALLAAPQQAVEDVLSEEEVIRWSSCFLEAEQPLLLFSTEKSGECFLYLQKLNPNVLHKYNIGSEGKGGCPIGFTATLENKCITLMCLYSNGCVYKLLVSLHPSAEGEQHLPKSLLLKLPVSERVLRRAAIASLEEGHIAIVGAPPSASTGHRDLLCIWNTNFQTLQASKQLAGGAYGQLWCNAGKLYVTHGKVLTVLPYRCEKSSLAAALGKLKQTSTQEVMSSPSVLNWNSFPYEEVAVQQRTGMRTRSSKLNLKSQATLSTSINHMLEDIKGVSREEVEEVLEPFLSCSPVSPQFQLCLAYIAVELLKRCKADRGFYPQSVLARLAQTGRLSHSSCPRFLMLALEKRDYFLAQLCLQHFPDIPEAVVCACLKAFLSVADADLVRVSVDLDGVSVMEGPGQSLEGVQNGFSPVLLEEDSCDVQLTPPKLDQSSSWTDVSLTCPVGLKKSALLNEIIRSSYSESFLLPHLKDLSAQQVILFLQYLQYLYVRSSGDVYTQLPGLRAPTITQIVDWVSLLLDAHFAVLVMAPEAKGLLAQLHRFVRSQVRLYSELGKIQGTLQELGKINKAQEIGLYSIEVIELF
ncbi:nucleolar protein 11-like [Acipenser oxyrinchus oxyrinchus]|uniref:Nucleolar protein 11-like n=1 Tax=Acipenser oxyrinchus oxyrinchus TaxID=40147 RepID=A0AAD8D4W5_ACIOX|nr:nucleolar protein 11-like [Acipenser oxyrinchus oxyrinchus]